MSINPTRAEARYKITEARLNEVESKMKGFAAVAAGCHEIFNQMQAVKHRLMEQTNLTVKDDKLIKELEAEYVALADSYNKSLLAKDESYIKMGVDGLYIQQDMLSGILRLQEVALQRLQITYPAKLARHLRKCRMYGWSDARLGGKKK